MTSEPSLFPDLEPVADRLEGLGPDARRTLRQADEIAAGRHPGSGLPLHPEAARERKGTGLRCKGCVHLYHAAAGGKQFLKCEQLGPRWARGEWGPDMRAWWPACRDFAASEQVEEVD